MCGVCVAESDHPGIFSFPALYEAYERCRTGKRNTINALKFEVESIDRLLDLSAALAAGSYQPARSVCFVAGKPKAREIMAADFGDRVVHHLLVPRLEQIFEPKFIHDSYACRQGKGTHAAVARLRQFMNRVSLGGKRRGWYLQLDIHNFFMSIDHDILCRFLARHVRSASLFSLAERIIRHDCTMGAVCKGSAAQHRQVPAHKSLFHVPPGKGLPIGNLTSQFFANVYLNELDQFVRHGLRQGLYLRYVDDFVLLDADPERLLACREQIVEFLREGLALRLKDGGVLKPVANGADFLGYIVRPHYLLCRRRVVTNCRQRLLSLSGEIVVRGRVNNRDYTLYHLRPEVVRRLRQTLASYLGHFRHAASGGLVASLFRAFPVLTACFGVTGRYKLVSRLEPPFAPRSLRRQYQWFSVAFAGTCVLFQVGNHCELYGEQAERYAGPLRLRLRRDGRRGLGPEAGFPLACLARVKRRALEQGIRYVVAAEQGGGPCLKQRVVSEWLCAVDDLWPSLERQINRCA